MNIKEFFENRHSVRKFTDAQVPLTDIEDIIYCAGLAASGKNKQNWHYVVVTNKDKINNIAQIIKDKIEGTASKLEEIKEQEKFSKTSRFATFFKNAPVVILLYAEEYEISGLEVLEKTGESQEVIDKIKMAMPGIQNIGASMENLLLAAANMNYGTCWMTSPNYAANEIEEYIGLDLPGYSLVALTPLGRPDGEQRSPKKKDVKDIYTVID